MSLAVVHTTPAPANRQGQSDVNKVISGLHKQHPKAGTDRLAELLADELLDDKVLLSATARHLVERWRASNNKARQRRSQPSAKVRIARRIAEKVKVAEIVEQVQAAVLDQMVTLLSGEQKKLRFCYGRELGELGAAYSKIAARVPADALCGECLTSGEVAILISEFLRILEIRRNQVSVAGDAAE